MTWLQKISIYFVYPYIHSGIDFDFLRAVEKIEKRLKLARKMVEETQHTNAEVSILTLTIYSL
jgi:hypothetical protein